MALSIQSNVASLNSASQLASRPLDRAFTRLSSGYRITTSQDAAAGLTIREEVLSQVRSAADAANQASQSNQSTGGSGATSNLGGLRSGAYSINDILNRANTTIRDVDVAEETASLSRSQVLMQAGVSALAQANATPQLALALLRG